MQWCLPPLWHLPWQSPLSVQPPDEWESTYHFSKSFLLRSIIQKEPKRDPPVPPAAVVQVHWLSTQWSSAPPEQVVVVQSPSLLHVSAYTESILSFDLYNGVKMQRFHSWTHYPRNSFFYAERNIKNIKNIKKCTVCHFCLAWNWWNLKKNWKMYKHLYYELFYIRFRERKYAINLQFNYLIQCYIIHHKYACSTYIYLE